MINIDPSHFVGLLSSSSSWWCKCFSSGRGHHQPNESPASRPKQTKDRHHRPLCQQTLLRKATFWELVTILGSLLLGISSRLNRYIFDVGVGRPHQSRETSPSRQLQHLQRTGKNLIPCHLFKGRAPRVHPKDCWRWPRLKLANQPKNICTSCHLFGKSDLLFFTCIRIDWLLMLKISFAHFYHKAAFQI